MKIVDFNKQTWEGFFGYVDEEGYCIEPVVHFKMDLIFNKNSFYGTTVDEETKELFKNPITVNGFKEKDIISFKVMYPCNYYFDEIQNKLIIDTENEYPGCDYYGEFNTEENKYIGTWEIKLNEFKEGIYQKDYIEELYTGYWEMWQIN